MSHRDVMVQLAKTHGWASGAELGVGKGYLFERLLTECPALRLVGVDLFHRPERKARAMGVLARFPVRGRLLVCSTVEGANYIADASLDFVFVDAGHSYRAVSQDIAAWRSKVKPGGWFGGHDYAPKFPGVKQAVHEAFEDRVDLLPETIWVAR